MRVEKIICHHAKLVIRNQSFTVQEVTDFRLPKTSFRLHVVRILVDTLAFQLYSRCYFLLVLDIRLTKVRAELQRCYCVHKAIQKLAKTCILCVVIKLPSARQFPILGIALVSEGEKF